MSDTLSRSHAAERPVVVIGAGVIGITTAIRLLESCRGPVHIIAEHLPSDPPTARYASLMAGAHHLSFADDADLRQRKWDRRSEYVSNGILILAFQVMMKELEESGEDTGLMKIQQTEYYVGEKTHLKIYEEHPDFRINDPRSLDVPFDVDHSISFTSLTMTPSVYLGRLAQRFTSLGGHIHRRALRSLQDLSDANLIRILGGNPSAIVVCTGIGSLTLGQVEDHAVHPVRGQIVKINAPGVKEGFTRQIGSLAGGEGGERTYVIPRMTGEVILGGTREAGDWEENPREETGKDILRRAAEICPSLSLRGGESLESIVVSHLVGFRPARVGGVRLERGRNLELGDDQTPVLYNYGHGGAGWQSSWGCAEDAAALVMQSLAS